MAEHVHQACGETSAATTLVSSVGSQRREKPLQHPPGASHRASPVKFDQDGVHTQLRVAVTSTTSANRPPSWGRTACQATQRSEQGRSTRLIWRVMQSRMPAHEHLRPPRQAQRAGVKDRSRRAVTAMTARGAAREPGGAGRRHATLLRHSHRIKNSRVMPVDFFLRRKIGR